MAEQKTGEMQPTLGLTGLTVNAMALIAPGAFLWLTFAPQATEGATAPAMWIGSYLRLCCVWRPRFLTRKWQKCIPEPGVRTILPSNPSSTTIKLGNMPA